MRALLVLLLATNSWALDAPGIYKKYAKAVVQVRTATTGGSGVFISKRGYVLTCAHVVEKSSHVHITTYPGFKQYEADVIKRDEVRDLALIRLQKPGKTFTSVKLKKTSLFVGQGVYSISHPQGLIWVLSIGIVSGHELFYKCGYRIQSTVLTSFGSSGAPLFNTHGRLVGILTARNFFVGSPLGISYAVTSKDIQEFLTPRLKLKDMKGRR